MNNNSKDEIKKYKTRLKRVKKVCLEAYKLMSKLNGNVEALDNLLAAYEDRKIPHRTMLTDSIGWRWSKCNHLSESVCGKCYRDLKYSYDSLVTVIENINTSTKTIDATNQKSSNKVGLTVKHRF